MSAKESEETKKGYIVISVSKTSTSQEANGVKKLFKQVINRNKGIPMVHIYWNAFVLLFTFYFILFFSNF